MDYLSDSLLVYAVTERNVPDYLVRKLVGLICNLCKAYNNVTNVPSNSVYISLLS
jgi:hypothetical protein